MRVIPVTFRGAAAVAGLLARGVLAPTGLHAQAASQTVTFEVRPISLVAVDGAPVLTIHYSRSASASANVTTGTAGWAVTTNLDGAKVTASLESELPAGLTLSLA